MRRTVLYHCFVCPFSIHGDAFQPILNRVLLTLYDIIGSFNLMENSRLSLIIRSLSIASQRILRVCLCPTVIHFVQNQQKISNKKIQQKNDNNLNNKQQPYLHSIILIIWKYYDNSLFTLAATKHATRQRQERSLRSKNQAKSAAFATNSLFSSRILLRNVSVGATFSWCYQLGG